MMIAILIIPVLVIGITCTVTLSTINTVSQCNAGYGTGVKYLKPDTPPLPNSAYVLLMGNCILHMGNGLRQGLRIIYGVRGVCGVIRYSYAFIECRNQASMV